MHFSTRILNLFLVCICVGIGMYGCIHVYICEYMCAWVHMHICVCAHVDQRLTLSIFFDYSQLCYLLSLSLELPNLSRLAQEILSPPPESWDSKWAVYAHLAGDLNSLLKAVKQMPYPLNHPC